MQYQSYILRIYLGPPLFNLFTLFEFRLFEL
jgi:hypothetical protein